MSKEEFFDEEMKKIMNHPELSKALHMYDFIRYELPNAVFKFKKIETLIDTISCDWLKQQVIELKEVEISRVQKEFEKEFKKEMKHD